MSVSTYATVINNDSSMDYVKHKRDSGATTARTKTQKRKYNEELDSRPATTNSSAIQNIHKQFELGGGDDANGLGNFTPMNPSNSYREQMSTLPQNARNAVNMQTTLSDGGFSASQPNMSYTANLMEHNAFGTDYDAQQQSNAIYANTIPNYTPANAHTPMQAMHATPMRAPTQPPYIHRPPQNYMGGDNLMQKLNYIITMLEDQKDEKTNNVTEEVVLYSFLGIFIIFVADSFSKVGKYVR